MKKIIALLLSVAMLLIPMSALADTIEPSIDYTNDKVTITGEFLSADGAEDKIATLVVLKDGKTFPITDLAADAEFISWADQCFVKDGKFTFVIDTSATANGTYNFNISAPGVAKTFDGSFTYDAAIVEDAILEQLNDSKVKAAGIDNYIRVAARGKIVAIDAEVVEDYEALKNPMKVATALIGKRPFATLKDFVDELKEAVKKQAKAEKGSTTGGGGGGSTPSFGGGASGGIIAPATNTNPFVDIHSSYWGKDAILNLYSKNIVKGNNGYFRPNDTITRAEFVQMVVMAFGFSMTGTTANFTDVTNNDWFVNAVQVAYSNGVVNGITATTFSPLANITRQDMMTILYNAAKAKNINLTNSGASFTDADSISGYAQNAVAAMVGSSVVSGYPDGSVKPLNNATRAEAAAMLSRLLEVK